MAGPRFAYRGLYGIADSVALAEALLGGGVRVLQLRDKTSDGRQLLEKARAFRLLTRAQGACFIVNDRLDIALLSEADGVHVGQYDLPPEDVRRVARQVGREDLLIGLSTHDLGQVKAALAQPVDYIGFGPVFGTTTKADALPPRGLGLLQEAAGLAGSLPLVAIGGISLGTASAVRDAGASMAAVIGDVVTASDRVGRVRELNAFLTPATA